MLFPYSHDFISIFISQVGHIRDVELEGVGKSKPKAEPLLIKIMYGWQQNLEEAPKEKGKIGGTISCSDCNGYGSFRTKCCGSVMC